MGTAARRTILVHLSFKVIIDGATDAVKYRKLMRIWATVFASVTASNEVAHVDRSSIPMTRNENRFYNAEGTKRTHSPTDVAK